MSTPKKRNRGTQGRKAPAHRPPPQSSALDEVDFDDLDDDASDALVARARAARAQLTAARRSGASIVYVDDLARGLGAASRVWAPPAEEIGRRLGHAASKRLERTRVTGLVIDGLGAWELLVLEGTASIHVDSPSAGARVLALAAVVGATDIGDRSEIEARALRVAELALGFIANAPTRTKGGVLRDRDDETARRIERALEALEDGASRSKGLDKHERARLVAAVRTDLGASSPRTPCVTATVDVLAEFGSDRAEASATARRVFVRDGRRVGQATVRSPRSPSARAGAAATIAAEVAHALGLEGERDLASVRGSYKNLTRDMIGKW